MHTFKTGEYTYPYKHDRQSGREFKKFLFTLVIGSCFMQLGSKHKPVSESRKYPAILQETHAFFWILKPSHKYGTYLHKPFI